MESNISFLFEGTREEALNAAIVVLPVNAGSLNISIKPRAHANEVYEVTVTFNASQLYTEINTLEDFFNPKGK
jgi:hypothetical protein